MSGPISNVETGKRTDYTLHEDIIGAVNFTKTKAHSDALIRLINMGLSEEEALKVLGERDG